MNRPRGLERWLAEIRRRNMERHRERQEFIRELMRDHAEYHRRGDLRMGYPHPGHPHPGHSHADHPHLNRQNRQQLDSFRKYQKYQHFYYYHRRLKYVRPVSILINLALWYLLIRFLGIGTLGIIVAILLSIGGIYEVFFLWRLEKQVFNPIDKLKKGVEEIAKGNYNVQVECDVLNDITLLVASFNGMARQLLESEKLKAEYEENRKTLIANISHDLKTPMTSIQGYIEAILERADLDAADRDKYLRIIYNNTAYMNRLIDDLFLFSKLDLAKLEFQFETIGVRNFMNDLMGEFRLELEEKEIRLDYADYLEDDCPVSIDRKRIHQAVRNIIGNAIKYGPENGLAIRAALYRRDGQVWLELHDNGPGIPEDKLPFIFDRFYRIDPERTKSKDTISTGLGLAIARELVEAHGGSIAVTSAPGAGSCFTIGLPVAECQGRESS